MMIFVYASKMQEWSREILLVFVATHNSVWKFLFQKGGKDEIMNKKRESEMNTRTKIYLWCKELTIKAHPEYQCENNLTVSITSTSPVNVVTAWPHNQQY